MTHGRDWGFPSPDRNSKPASSPTRTFRGFLIFQAGLVALMTILIYFWPFGVLSAAADLGQGFRFWFYQNAMPHVGTLFWWWAIGNAILFGVIVAYQNSNTRLNMNTASKALAWVLTVLFAISGLRIGYVLWDNDKDWGRFYNEATVVHVPDLGNPPASVKPLLEGAASGKGNCDMLGQHNVSACIAEGTLPDTGWEARIGSFQGSTLALESASGDSTRVSLLKDTMTYLNAQGEAPGRWSGILDGSGRVQALSGVAEWYDDGTDTDCLFTGDYAIDHAINGEWSNSLHSHFAEIFPALHWVQSDVWGYCIGKEPIVVMPVTKVTRYNDRTVLVPAGVVTVRGDHGKTVLKYIERVVEGKAEGLTLPGPVYPASIAKIQREEYQWSAGRGNKNRVGFGYEPTSADVQGSNVSEYLLRNEETGRLELVTPLTLRNSTSELFVAYSVISADSVDANALNTMDMYVLAEDDVRRVNIEKLEAAAKDWLSIHASGFLASGGMLREFTPVNGDSWRAYGEVNGYVSYYLDISANNQFEPKFVSIGGTSDGENTPPVMPGSTPLPGELPDCRIDNLSNLSVNQLALCDDALTEEFVRRANATATE